MKENLDYKPSYDPKDKDFFGLQFASGINQIFKWNRHRVSETDQNNMVLRGLVRLVSGRVFDIYPPITKDPNEITGNMFVSLKEKYSRNILKVFSADGIDFPLFDYQRKIVLREGFENDREPKLITYEAAAIWSKAVLEHQPPIWVKLTPKQERDWEAARDVQSIAFISRLVFEETAKSAKVKGLPPLMVPQVYWKL